MFPMYFPNQTANDASETTGSPLYVYSSEDNVLTGLPILRANWRGKGDVTLYANEDANPSALNDLQMIHALLQPAFYGIKKVGKDGSRKEGYLGLKYPNELEQLLCSCVGGLRRAIQRLNEKSPSPAIQRT
ncbi:hypothetical protein CEXT_116171 [Caerostris extrusa]|uniref:Uncharacterized protein n=1 Tax=Caerostris extrusa TaxID=172846 RepID=A0AAV4T9E0_CAEEX|nr:hypothetical protein CEXT_116171 [Caerostris extrusa]